MKKNNPAFEKYIFVCEHTREKGVCCGKEGSDLCDKIKKEVKRQGLSHKIRVSRSGCLDVCQKGPNVLIAPQFKWLSQASDSDINEIIADCLKN